MQKQLLLIPLTFLFVIFSIFTSSAQKPKIDIDIQKEFLQQKAKHYQQLYSVEQQKTTNQDDYDVKYYSLDLTPDPTTSTLTGKVEVVAEVISASLDHVELNFWTGMTIIDIHRTDSPEAQLSYTHTSDLLSIILDSTYTQGEQFGVVIAYNGKPQNSIYSSFRFDSYAGEPLMWSFSEPFGARAWWPCKDVPSDKADSVDIRVTVPNEFIVASNGTLREKNIEGNLTTYWWHEQYPIVTYLVSVAIYPYRVYYDDYLYNEDADTMKIHFYVFPDNYDRYFAINAQVKDMISFFSQIYGEYPFIEEKYGHADFLLGGAMEHQTCTSFGYWADWIYAHELAHQWWGDLVTCDSFHHIWLNEGFATYSEALWFEHAYPEAITASEYLMTYRLYQGAGTVYLEDPMTEPIFHGGLTYNKAAWVMHMLRYVVGNDVFFEILKTYGSSPEHRYGTATTDEFQAICEQVSGLDLEQFFQQWIYEEYYPHYAYGWNLKPVESSYQINLGIEQIQKNTVLFRMPVDVRITTSSYDTVFVVWDSLQSQTFEFFVDEEPVNVEIDPNNWILKKSEEKMLAPHAQNISINNTYQAPGTDTLILTSDTENPDNHSLELEATIESIDQSIIETISMYDDGLHDDGAAGDGIFGAFWPVPLSERYYNVHIKTLSFNSGYYNILQNAVFFTTTGPVVLNSFKIVSEDTIANPNDRLVFEFTLSNEGATETVYNVSTKTISLDTCARIIAFTDPQYGDIAPGESSVASRPLTILFDQDCPAPAELSFALDIYTDGRLLWSDTFSVNIVTGIADEKSALPLEFALKQNYPNPFNPSTVINYELPTANIVELSIYNLLGQKVATLVSERKAAGDHQVEWDATGFSSGIYYYQIRAGEFQAVRKMILLR